MKYQANIEVPLEQLLDRCSGSLYKLVLTVGKRAQEIAEGKPLLIEGSFKKPMVAAMMEALAGKLSCAETLPKTKSKRKRR